MRELFLTFLLIATHGCDVNTESDIHNQAFEPAVGQVWGISQPVVLYDGQSTSARSVQVVPIAPETFYVFLRVRASFPQEHWIHVEIVTADLVEWTVGDVPAASGFIRVADISRALLVYPR